MARAKHKKGIHKRKGSPYWYFRHPHSKLRVSSGTTERREAEALLAKLRLEAFNGQFGKKPSITLDSLFARYMLEHAQYLKSSRAVERYCSNLLKHLGNTLAETITQSDISLYKAKRRAENPELSNSTINRELEYLRCTLNTARSWGYNTPDMGFKGVMLREPEARTKYLTPEQAEQLLDACSPLIRDVVEFALYTGLRVENILSLKWSQVNPFTKEITVQLKSNIPTGKALRLPVSKKMNEILKRQSRKGEYVFKNTEGSRIVNYDRPFKNAKNKLFKETKDPIWEDFRFHDLRHTAATWLRMAGTPLEVVQEVLGHTNIATTRKYAKVNRAEISDAMNNLAQIRHSKMVN